MKKKYLLLLLVVIIIIGIILISVKIINSKKENSELEAVQIFEKRAAISVDVDNSHENIDEIQKSIQNMKYVKEVTKITKEDKLEEFKNKFVDSDFSVDEGLFSDIPTSFIIKFDINSVNDFDGIEIIENNLMNINGIEKVESDGCNEIIKVYKTTGIKGLREYDKIYSVIDEQGIEGVTKYLDEHPEIRELLKDYIHF